MLVGSLGLLEEDMYLQVFHRADLNQNIDCNDLRNREATSHDILCM